MTSALDCWQLCSLGLAMALPLRPDELTAILIGDVDLVRREIGIGTRLGGGDFTKGRVWHRGLHNNRTQLRGAIFAYQVLMRYNHQLGNGNGQIQWIMRASNPRHPHCRT